MVRKPSRKAWQIYDAPKPESAKRSTLEGLAVGKKKLPKLRPHALTPVSALPRADDNRRLTYDPPYSYKVGRALSESRPYFKELRKRHHLKTDDLIALLRALIDHYEDPFYDDAVDDEEHDESENTPPDTRPEDAASTKPPETAPALWKGRDLNLRENAPQFIRRVYAEWLGHGLERKDIARLDPDLYKALSVWLSRHPDDPIIALLPPQREKLDELIDVLAQQYPLEELRKLGHAIDARLRRERQKA